MSNQNVKAFFLLFVEVEVRNVVEYLKLNNNQSYKELKENLKKENIGVESDIDYISYRAVDFIIEDIEQYHVYTDSNDLNEIVIWAVDAVVDSIIKQY